MFMKSYRYESVIIFASDLDEKGVNAQLDKVAGIITSHGGTLEKRDIWGRRELAYKIKKRTHGVYTCVVFSGDSAVVADLDRQLKINEGVIRHLVVLKDQYAPDLVPGRRMDDTMPMDAIGFGSDFPTVGEDSPM